MIWQKLCLAWQRLHQEGGQSGTLGLPLAFLAAGGLLSLGGFMALVLAGSLNLALAEKADMQMHVQAAAQYAAEQFSLGNLAVEATGAGGIGGNVVLSPGRAEAAFGQAFSEITGLIQLGDEFSSVEPQQWYSGPLVAAPVQIYQWSNLGQQLPNGETVTWPGVWAQVAVNFHLPPLLPVFGDGVVATENVQAFAPANTLDTQQQQMDNAQAYVPGEPPPNIPPIPHPPGMAVP